MREIIPINYRWKFIAQDNPIFGSVDYDDSDWQVVDIPHTFVELPLHYLDDQIFCFTGWYRVHLDTAAVHRFAKAFLRFEAVATYAEVYINGQLAGTHKGGYTPFVVAIPSLVSSDNLLIAVRVDASERPEIPPFGNVIDYLTFGGIYREVCLDLVHEAYIEDVCIRTHDILTQKKRIEADIRISQSVTQDMSVHVSVFDGEGRQILKAQAASATKNLFRYEDIAPEVQLWDTERPVLYCLNTKLFIGDELIDESEVRFAFREIRCTPSGMLINGISRQLRGLNRHQSYPYVGYAMPASQQRADADVLKYELGVDIVRTSHYPQHRAFLDRCDEIGLLVFPEIPGWQYVGKDQEWRSLMLLHVREMIERDRNHPSIVLWGVRINESADDDELYSRANELARWLDRTRQTSGVRNFAGSHLIEDVYSYNDFIHRGDNRALGDPDTICKKARAPFIVSEHTGHMFPTKTFDPPDRRLEHALRHARILNEMYRTKRRCAVIGWCMSDYYTHRYFGSGDQVCHHGVTDMFRIPKLAAAVYASQSDREPVLVVSSQMDIGDHAAHHIGSVYVFTNCDAVKVSYNNEPVGTYFPDRKHFAYLPHPPVVIDDFIGNRLDKLSGFSDNDKNQLRRLLLQASKRGFDLRVKDKISMWLLLKRKKLSISDAVRFYETYVGWLDSKEREWTFTGIRNDQEVAIVRHKASKHPRLELSTQRDSLIADGPTYDVVKLTVRAVSDTAMTLPYCNDPLSIETTGPISVIGPRLVSLSGGAVGVYVRTTTGRGTGLITVTSCALGSASLQLKVV